MNIGSRNKRLLLAALVGLVCIGVLVFIGRIVQIGQICRISRICRIDVTPTPSPTSTPAPTPTPLPIAPGKQVYSIRSDSSSPGPLISEATFDPLDVVQGGEMTVTVKAKDASSITITMIDDAGMADHALTPSSSGVWTGTISSPTTHNRIYGATIVAKNTRGEERKVELWFR